MIVKPNQIHISANQQYMFWDREMAVTVMQHSGVHGFHSCVIIIERMDSPMEVLKNDWYDSQFRGMRPKPVLPMQEWIAAEFTRISHGEDDNSCEVEGLKEA